MALGTIVVLASAVTVLALLATSIVQAINPVAAVTALTVALIGIAWFKKASH